MRIKGCAIAHFGAKIAFKATLSVWQLDGCKKCGNGAGIMVVRVTGFPLFIGALVAFLAIPVCRGQLASSVTSAVDRADALAAQKNYPAALGAYREADKLSGHTCADCYLHIATTELLLGDIPGAVDDSARAARTAGDDGPLAADAHVLRGQVLSAMASGPTDPKLKEAELEFHAAIMASPKKSKARFCLGLLLLSEGRDAEGVAELKTYVSSPMANPRTVDRAMRLIADPSRGRALPSEDFSFTTLEGEKISKDGLRGRVVLLDFWGTWCPPCRESVPVLQDIHQKFAGKSFEMVGISSDEDEQKWRSFIAEHHMSWSEYIDLDGQIQSLFEINAFPTFIVLDRDGGIQFRQSGLGGDTETELEGAINSALQKSFSAKPVSTIAVAPPSPAVPPAVAPATAATADDTSVPGTAQWQASSLPLQSGVARIASSTGTSEPAETSKFVFPPEDVENGDARENNYRNDFLGLSYKFPQSWTPATEEELEQLNAKTLRWMSEQPPAQTTRIAFPKTIFQANLDSRNRVPFVRITVQLSDTLTLDSVRKDADDLKQLRGLTIVAAPQEIAGGKRAFFRTDFEMSLGDSPTWITSFESLAGQYLVTLEICARSKQELDTLARTAQSLTISKR